MFDKGENQFYQEHGHNHYVQLKHNEKRLLQELSGKNNILLWGHGRRGKAFEKWCVEKNIQIEIYDKKDNDDVSLKYFLEKADVVVGSNSMICAEIKEKSMVKCKVVDLEEYSWA